MNIEKIVAKAVLQEESEITICGTTYNVGQPTLATLIKLSEYAAELPEFDMANNVLSEVLTNAKDCKNLARMAALMILGAKRVRENHFVAAEETELSVRWSWKSFGFVPTAKVKHVRITEVQKLAQDIEDNVSPSELLKIVTTLLTQMQVSDFFGLTASLRGTNLLKATKEAEEIAFGE